MPEPVTVKKSIIFTATDYGGVILDDRTGQYWQLNATSAAIFTGLQSGLDMNTVAQQIVDSFDDVDLGSAISDATDLVQQLRTAGIIE